MYQNQQTTRKYRTTGGSYSQNRTTTPPRPRKTKGPSSTPGIPCRVKNAEGQYYDFMGKDRGNYLFVNQIQPEGHTFLSRHQASRAVWHTIEWIKYETGDSWEKRDFSLENVT